MTGLSTSTDSIPQARNQRWSLYFVVEALPSGRRFRILKRMDDCTRGCVGQVGRYMAHRLRVTRVHDRIAKLRG